MTVLLNNYMTRQRSKNGILKKTESVTACIRLKREANALAAHTYSSKIGMATGLATVATVLQ